MPDRILMHLSSKQAKLVSKVVIDIAGLVLEVCLITVFFFSLQGIITCHRPERKNLSDIVRSGMPSPLASTVST